MGAEIALATLGFEELQHLNELAENKNLLAFRNERIEQLEQSFGFAGKRIVADEFGMAADLTQASEGGKHVNLALADTFLGDGLHYLLAAATEFGKIKFPLFIVQLAIATLLDAVRQIFGDMFFEAAQKQRAQFCGESAASDALG